MKDCGSYRKSCSKVSGANWGCEKIHQKRVTYSEVVKVSMSNTTKDLDAALVGDDLMLLQYQMIDDATCTVPRKSNVFLASFTTANARVILYNYLSKIKNPLYDLLRHRQHHVRSRLPLICRKLQIFQRGPILGR